MINLKQRPVKPKYIDEEMSATSFWQINGYDANDLTKVFVGDGNSDWFDNVPYELAEQLVAHRKKYVLELLAIINSPEQSQFT